MTKTQNMIQLSEIWAIFLNPLTLFFTVTQHWLIAHWLLLQYCRRHLTVSKHTPMLRLEINGCIERWLLPLLPILP